ncbi:DUF4065 domain-containing protein [Escherichia coli]|nr:DUF4065 domain-containing protein [Escherichia coli]MCZ5700312.1 DUF4065 domain-containing protein [Escherichia coli]MCZ5754203.1 DUF4065 domain-containing protein [Escherichia coli]
MYSPVQIANKFITLGNQHHNPLTHMQLQKLTYIAHGYYLALTGKPLLNECVSAWKYGPVIPGMYDAFKDYGNKPVTNVAVAPLVASLLWIRKQRALSGLFISFTARKMELSYQL